MAAEVIRKRLERESMLRYAALEEIEWPTSQNQNDELEAVTE